MTESQVDIIIRKVIDRAASELAGVRMKELSPSQPLFGGKGALLDSLNLVSFIFILEDEFCSVTGKSIKVSTNDILSKEETPFRDLKALESWLAKRI